MNLKPTLACFFFVVCTHAQIVKADTLTVNVGWQEGSTYRYRVNKYQLVQQNERQSQRTWDYQISMQIREATQKNYLLAIKTDSAETNLPAHKQDLLDIFQNQIINKLVFMVKTDENGTLLGIKNWQALRDSISQWTPRLEILKRVNEEQKEQIILGFRSLTNSKSKIKALFSKEFAILFAYNGYRFPIKERSSYTEQFPNLYGGQALSKSGSITIDPSELETNNSIIIIDESAIDEEQGKEALLQVLRRVNKDRELLEEQIKDLVFTISDSIRLSLDLDSGSLLKASTERQVISNDLKTKNTQIDRQNWTLTEVVKN
jgi:hypothetical protein